MKLSIVFLRIAGFICLFFMVFHAFFHKMFDWPNSLACLNQNNRAILLTYHYISILITGYMAAVSLFQAKALMQTKVKYSALGMFALFFLIRIITEFTLFGFRMPQSAIIFIMCIVPMVLFIIPMFYKIPEK